jgi:hypothetical protein
LLRVDDQAEGTAEGLDPVALPAGAAPPFEVGASASKANRYSGWPFQVIWPRPVTPMPLAGTPLLPGDPLLSAGGHARAQAEIPAHDAPYDPRSLLKV